MLARPTPAILAPAVIGRFLLSRTIAETWTDAEEVWDSAWRNFKPHELACRCGGLGCAGRLVVDADVMTRLQWVREQLGRPLIVTSGTRCGIYNASIGGAVRSMHRAEGPEGLQNTFAVDVSLRGHIPRELYQVAEQAGFRGFGFGASFLHLDRGRARRWDYGSVSRGVWIAAGIIKGTQHD